MSVIRSLISRVNGALHAFKIKRKWRIINVHNMTTIFPRPDLDISSIKVGKYTYGVIECHGFGGGVELRIGSFCSIAGNVKFMLVSGHSLDELLTYPLRTNILKEDIVEATSKGSIIVEDDVWIGENAIILSGVTIHQGAVIGAGAVVAKDIPAYAIAIGVPARVVRFRFDKDIIDELVKINFGLLSAKFIEEHKKEFCTKISNLEQLEFMKILGEP